MINADAIVIADKKTVRKLRTYYERATAMYVTYTNDISFICPNCGKFHTKFIDIKYCHYCGQRIKFDGWQKNDKK